MFNPVQHHYQSYPYPHYPLLASVRRCDTYALNLEALWMCFNRRLPPPEARKILIAGRSLSLLGGQPRRRHYRP